MHESSLPPRDGWKDTSSNLATCHADIVPVPSETLSGDGVPSLSDESTLQSRPRSKSLPRHMAIKPAKHSQFSHEESTKDEMLHSSRQRLVNRTEGLVSSDMCQGQVRRGHDRFDVEAIRELSGLEKLESYKTEKSHQTQRHLWQAQVKGARAARLKQSAYAIQRTLAECIRAEDKENFATLFNAYIEASQNACEPWSGSQADRYFQEPELVVYPASFLDTLDAGARHTILAFLSHLRSNDNFLANCLATLPSPELLMALLPDRGLTDTGDSIFGPSSRPYSRNFRYLAFAVDRQTRCLSCASFVSPLDTLIHAVRDLAIEDLEQDDRATGVWAQVCATLIFEQKPGCERFVPAVLDCWATSCQWEGRDRMQLWLLDTLRRGAFLQERPGQHPKIESIVTPDGLHADDVQADFYCAAVESLLSLLGQCDGPSVIPESAIKICLRTYQRLEHSARHQSAFPNFVLTRWLCSFVANVITLPETFGLLTDHFISDFARHFMLREISNRFRKAVFDVVYAWKHGRPPSSKITGLVQAIASRFVSEQDGLAEAGFTSCEPTTSSSEEPALLAISVSDLRTIVDVLFPREYVPSTSASDSASSGSRSSASSTSGFSLLQDDADAQRNSFGVNNLWGDVRHHATETRYGQTVGLNVDLKSATFSEQGCFDAQAIRSACAGIIEDEPSTRISGNNQLCILVQNSVLPGLRTMLEVLERRVSDFPNQTDNGLMLLAAGEGLHENIIDFILEDQRHFLSLSTLNRLDFRAALLRRLKQRIRILESKGDFAIAQRYHSMRYSEPVLLDDESLGSLQRLMDARIVEARRSLSVASALEENCDSFIRTMRPTIKAHQVESVVVDALVVRLRDKMWYTAEVRTSAIYENTRAVLLALKAMGIAKKSERSQALHPMQSRTSQKPLRFDLHLKTEAQLLEIISVPKKFGGPNKLNDEQSRILSAWIDHNGVENLCKGEERLHKLCMEINKAVSELTAANAMLKTSPLYAREDASSFERDREALARSAAGKATMPLWQLFPQSSFKTGASRNDESSSTRSVQQKAHSRSEDAESRSSTPTSTSSRTIWSPHETGQLPPVQAEIDEVLRAEAVRMRSTVRRTYCSSLAGYTWVELVRRRTVALLMSDLTSSLFANGSETDRAFWQGLGGEFTTTHLHSQAAGSRTPAPIYMEDPQLDFEDAFRPLLARFEASIDPYTKIGVLSVIDHLMVDYIPTRRLLCTCLPPHPISSPHGLGCNPHQTAKRDLEDRKVEGFRRVFCNSSLRPKALFRDLQYIAALVPSWELESTAQGEAFSNAAVAVASLKREAISIMVETADSIIAHHANNRGSGCSSSTAQSERDSATFSAQRRSPPAEDIGRYTMSDAAHLLLIAAKEGDPTAQREVATLYMTHPEIMPRTLAPLARPREVFREELQTKWRKNQDRGWDPAIMCLAHHWMSLSAKGGDVLARDYLRQNEEVARAD